MASYACRAARLVSSSRPKLNQQAHFWPCSSFLPLAPLLLSRYPALLAPARPLCSNSPFHPTSVLDGLDSLAWLRAICIIVGGKRSVQGEKCTGLQLTTTPASSLGRPSTSGDKRGRWFAGIRNRRSRVLRVSRRRQRDSLRWQAGTPWPLLSQSSIMRVSREPNKRRLSRGRKPVWRERPNDAQTVLPGLRPHPVQLLV